MLLSCTTQTVGRDDVVMSHRGESACQMSSYWRPVRVLHGENLVPFRSVSPDHDGHRNNPHRCARDGHDPSPLLNCLAERERAGPLVGNVFWINIMQRLDLLRELIGQFPECALQLIVVLSLAA